MKFSKVLGSRTVRGRVLIENKQFDTYKQNYGYSLCALLSVHYLEIYTCLQAQISSYGLNMNSKSNPVLWSLQFTMKPHHLQWVLEVDFSKNLRSPGNGGFYFSKTLVLLWCRRLTHIYLVEFAIVVVMPVTIKAITYIQISINSNLLPWIPNQIRHGLLLIRHIVLVTKILKRWL